MRKYPHQEVLRWPDHRRKTLLYLGLLRSQVLNATGTKSSSAARFIPESANILPASLHPDQPLHSTKLAKMGFPGALALSFKAKSKSP